MQHQISGPMKFSMLFFPKFLACASLKYYGKNMENFPGSPRYDAKHWASVEISLNMIGSLHVHIILQTIYVLKREILQFLGLKPAVYNRERLQIKSGL